MFWFFLASRSFCLLKFELAYSPLFANRRFGLWGDFDKVKIFVARNPRASWIETIPFCSPFGIIRRTFGALISSLIKCSFFGIFNTSVLFFLNYLVYPPTIFVLKTASLDSALNKCRIKHTVNSLYLPRPLYAVR